LISPVSGGEKAGTRGETKTKPNNRKNRCGPSVAVERPPPPGRPGFAVTQTPPRQTRRGAGTSA